jgi:hypothetical protein
MIERGGGLGLLHEAAFALRITDCLRPKDFDRDGTIEMHVGRLVHHTHTAFAKPRFNAIVA